MGKKIRQDVAIVEFIHDNLRQENVVNLINKLYDIGLIYRFQ